LSSKLAERNVLASAYGPYIIRFVTHLDVNREQCSQALGILAAVCGGRPQLSARDCRYNSKVRT